MAASGRSVDGGPLTSRRRGFSAARGFEYMRNVRTNGTEGSLAQSGKYVKGVLNSGVVRSGVPKFTIQSSRDAAPVEGRPTVYVRACADLSTVAMKNPETGATLDPAEGVVGGAAGG